MKTLLRLVGFVFLPAIVIAAEVKVGDSFASVQAGMGQPRGQLQLGDWTKLYFAHGDVEVRRGVVTRVALRSEAEQQKYESRRSADEQRAAVLNTVRLARLAAEGEALKARFLADENFKNSSFSQQLAAWRMLKFSYPMVDCSAELGLLLARQGEQVAAANRPPETSARLDRLEALVQERTVTDYYDSNTYLIGDASWRDQYNAANYYSNYSNNRYGSYRHRGYWHSRHDRNRDVDCRDNRGRDRTDRGNTSSSLTEATSDWNGVPRFVPFYPPGKI